MIQSAGSVIASIMFIWAMARQFFPRHFETYVTKYTNKIVYYFYPYIEISFPEYSGERFKRSDAYSAIESYLSGSSTEKAKRLKAEVGREGTGLILSMDEHEEVTDEFGEAKVWWYSSKITRKTETLSFYPAPEDNRYYRLIFHQAQRKLIQDSYLTHIMDQGKAIQVQKRQRKLYTNNSNYDRYDYRKLEWSHVPFEHPATFKTIAMDPIKKQELMQDLLTFSKSKEYYMKVGKPWKRGYLLYGPPGTGKSTMIAAMANLMDYDVYDLELTAVKNNTRLKKLLIETTNKSIIVIEDIDCSLDLAGKRKENQGQGEQTEEEKAKAALKRDDKEASKVTLSGLLNFIDGLWSACGGERLIVFTTNYVEKLDPALVRRGRMDMHVELSYCSFEAFKVLAKNYLNIEDHELFGEIKRLIENSEITPADVAENLMPKSLDGIDIHHVNTCLSKLVLVLKECKLKVEEKAKEEAAKAVKKAEEEAANAAKKAEEEKKVEKGAEENGFVGEKNKSEENGSEKEVSA